MLDVGLGFNIRAQIEDVGGSDNLMVEKSMGSGPLMLYYYK
jgi:hypothetical protein